ncbi:MAG: FAD-binding oxidoreductase, partial [Actinomycetes bacterium]|nr:FAD-binding oxidoreductase [Actinomycetes bacterium]MDX5450190.1 FAD-binding oxidoreductase [Actinomycetes bacterium]
MGTTVFERQRPDAALVADALAGSVLAPFWTDDAPGARFPRLTGRAETDLVIVGGGYSGLWTAVLAKERDPGRRIVLLEGRRVGWAASGRNGGFCEASLTHGRENGESRWPDELDELDRQGLANLDEIEATVARYGMDVHFERTGALAVAVEPHQVPWLAGEGFLDAEATRALVDSPTYLA